ncbi:MAG: hypothetical protein ABI165_09970 [Bryobacteraceae bacterium]
MKKQAMRFMPWAALMAVAVISTPRPAETYEPHPHIRSAIGALQAASEELRTAATDFCGHRAAAMRECSAAMQQLRTALACDRR